MKTENNPMHKETPPTYQFMLSPRCGAKTRHHTACLSPAVRGSKRCRMHGGKGSGAPKGSSNALTHGCTTREAIAERRNLKVIIRDWREFKDQHG